MRGIARTAATVSAAALTAALACASPALAATPPHWRVVQEFGASFGSPQLEGDLVSGARSAWVAGYTYASGDALFLARWNGSKWSQVSAPSAFSSASGSVSASALAASGKDLWVFPSVDAASNRVYAARLAAGHWSTWRLPGALTIGNAAAFGNADIWAFGQAVLPRGWTGLENGPGFAARFNGRSWRRVRMPGVPLEVQALSRNDIWAFGPTNRTAGAATQSFIAMHWNGRRWSTLSVPRIRATNGKLMWPGGLAVLAHNSLWVTEQFHCPSPGLCSPAQPPGMILAHWNGRKWVRVLDKSAYENPAAGPDGHRGLWIEATTVSNPRFVFLHYVHGRLGTTFLPASSAGTPGDVSLPAPIPGTNSAFSTGALPQDDGPAIGAVFEYGA